MRIGHLLDRSVAVPPFVELEQVDFHAQHERSEPFDFVAVSPAVVDVEHFAAFNLLDELAVEVALDLIRVDVLRPQVARFQVCGELPDKIGGP